MRCRHEKVEHINSQEALYASSSLQGKSFHDPLLPSTALTSELHTVNKSDNSFTGFCLFEIIMLFAVPTQSSQFQYN